MRLKKVKGATEKIDNSPYVVIHPEQYKGNFVSLFDESYPIHLEIGMGKGTFLIEHAKRYPHINFIGIEKYDSVLVRAVEKAEKHDLSNLKFIQFDAEHIEMLFDHEITCLYLNFSDPWPKARHAHRRLTSQSFLNRYDNIFCMVPLIIMKTDNRKLMEYSLIQMNQKGYQIQDISFDLYQDQPLDNIPTEYEMKFHQKGYPIYKVIMKLSR